MHPLLEKIRRFGLLSLYIFVEAQVMTIPYVNKKALMSWMHRNMIRQCGTTNGSADYFYTQQKVLGICKLSVKATFLFVSMSLYQ